MGDMLFETNMFIDVMDIDYLPFAFTLIFVIETGWHFCEVVGPLETHIMAWAHNYVSRKLRKKLVSTETGERQQVPRSMFLFQCHAVPLRQLPQHLIFGTHQREAIADGIQPWELLRWPWHNKNTAWILSKRMNTSDWILLDISPIQWLDPKCPFFPAANFDCRNLGSWKLPCSSVTGPHSKAG